MTQPTIARARTGSVVLTFPFDRWLVDELKAQIPGHARAYDPIGKAWTVTPAYAGIAIRLMYQAFTDVEMVDAAAGPTFDRGGDPREAALIVLHLRETAPPELVTAAHRCLAKLNHPDAGGSHETMLAVNAAAEALRGAR